MGMEKYPNYGFPVHKLGVKKSIGPLEKSAALEKACIRYVQMIHPPFKSSREMIQLQNNKMVKQKEEEKKQDRAAQRFALCYAEDYFP